MDIFSAANISASGLSAERTRMEVVAQNIANASTTRTPGGGPYRRQEVVFSAALDRQRAGGLTDFGGVQVVGIVPDGSELPRTFQPGHPDADAEGFVTFPNVNPVNEVVNLLSASRGYEANATAVETLKQMAQRGLDITR